MENEELFAGEPALDAQQHARDDSRTAAASKNTTTPLHVHTEPLLAGDDLDEEPPRYAELPRDTDIRPRWRRPHVSDSAYLYKTDDSLLILGDGRSGGCCHLASSSPWALGDSRCQRSI